MTAKTVYASGKKILCILLFLVLSGSLFAEIKVSRARLGTAGRALRYSWCELECMVENPDPDTHDVTVRLRPKSASDPQTNFYSSSLTIPGETVATLRFPVFVELNEEYNLDVFCDGRKVPPSVYNDMKLKLISYRDRVISLLNDSDESPGAITQLPGYKGSTVLRPCRGDKVPQDPLLYQDNTALLIFRPDFEHYSADQFQAILTFASEGGTVVFLDPQGVMAAAETPLAALLPVQPQKVVPVSDLDIRSISGFYTGANLTTDFLVSHPKERCLSLGSYNGFPLLSETQFGLGVVRVLHFPFQEKWFNGNVKAMKSLLDRLLSGPELIPNPKAFEETLDHLTGFNIPRTSDVLLLAALYLGGLLLILIAGFRLKHPCAAWGASALFSCVMIGYIMARASASFAHRQPVLAELTVTEEGPVPGGETFASCFMTEEKTLNVERPDARPRFSSIPPSSRIPSYFITSLEDDLELMQGKRKKKREKQTLRVDSMLELTRSAAGYTMLSGLTIAPRTSRQFKAKTAPVNGGEHLPDTPEPELLLSEKGMELAPFRLPEKYGKTRPEAVWLMLPGGFREVHTDSEGLYRLTDGGSVLVDEAAKDVAKTLLDGYRKPMPYLALVYPVRQHYLNISEKADPQGKNIFVIPVRITVLTRKVSLPAEMFCLSPVSTGARSLFRGNRVLSKVPLMTGMTLDLKLSLPVPLSQIFTPETMSFRVEKNMANVVSCKLAVMDFKDGGPEPVESVEKNGVFASRPDSLTHPLNPSDMAVYVRLSSKYNVDPASLSLEQTVRANSWYLHSLDGTMTGVIAETVPLPVKY